MRRPLRVRLGSSLLCMAVCTAVHAQGSVSELSSATDVETLIMASQGEASQLVFTTAGRDIPDITPGDFCNDRECEVRSGIPNFYDKIDRGEAVTVAFLGGSITKGDFSYRLQICKYLETLNPKTRFTWVNAGVSGTGTDLGSFRLGEHVLSYDPDLVFIEFSVNGAYEPGLEGIIRQLLRHDPHTDICLLHSISAGQTSVYRDGGLPQGVARMERVAAHYGIPSVHLACETSFLDGDGRICWYSSAGCGSDRIAFSNDGLHPLKAGGNLYAAALARGLAKMRTRNGSAGAHPLPEPLFPDRWEEARMYVPTQIATFDGDWRVETTAATPLKGFREWFAEIIDSSTPGAAFTFSFEGDMFGIFDIGGPECGQLEIRVDGHPMNLVELRDGGFRRYEASEAAGASSLINRFNRFCNNRYRGQHDVVVVQPGVHEVQIRISDRDCDKRAILGSENLANINAEPSRYAKKSLFLGRILIRGRAL